jgi:hypothetical protein
LQVFDSLQNLIPKALLEPLRVKKNWYGAYWVKCSYPSVHGFEVYRPEQLQKAFKEKDQKILFFLPLWCEAFQGL